MAAIKRRLSRMRDDQPATTRELALLLLETDRRDPWIWSHLADSLVELRVYRAARVAFNRQRTLSTRAMAYSLCTGEYHYFNAQGDLKAAERWARKAAKIAPAGFIYLGAVLAKQGRFKEAKACHRRAARAPEHPLLSRDEAFYNLGLILRAERRYAAALKAFDRAIEIDPRYALALEDRDDVRGAMRVVAPARRRAHWRLLMRKLRSQGATAHELARQFTRRYPREFEGWLALADVLAQFARYTEALDSVLKASELAVEAPWRESPGGAFVAQWANVRFLQKDFARAGKAYRRAVRMGGSRVSSYRIWLAETLVHQGRLGQAARMLRNVLHLRPKDPSMAHYLLGVIARSRRQYTVAIVHFNRALAHDRNYRKARVAKRDAISALALQTETTK